MIKLNKNNRVPDLGYEHWKNILFNYRNFNEAYFAILSIDLLKNITDEQKNEIITFCKKDHFLMGKPDITDILDKWRKNLKK